MIRKCIVAPATGLTGRACRLTYVLLILLLMTAEVRAQDPGMPGGPDYDPDKEVPIDGGMGILLAAGLAYGIRKIKETKRLNKEE